MTNNPKKAIVMNKKEALFIIGGMGPEASSYLYNTLIELSIKEFGAKNNDDFPEIILHSIPVPDFISDDQPKDKALEMLQTRIRAASKLNIACFSIACNTAHLLLDDLQRVTKVPFVSMIDEMIKRMVEDKATTVGILGTPSTIRSKLYQSALEKHGIKSILPSQSQIEILEKIIRNIIRGEFKQSDTQKLKKIADSLQKAGAKAIALGCTELPLVFPKRYKLPAYNSVEILARALLHKYYGQNTIGQRL